MNLKIAMAFSLILLAMPTALSIYGGETLTYNITKCDFLTVNITSSELGEWSATPQCSEQSAGNFYCACSDGWALSLTPAANSVGNFTITIINYWTEGEED